MIRPSSVIRLPFLFAIGCIAIAAVPACDCGAVVTAVSKTTLVIDSPVNMASYGPGDSFDYKAVGNDSVGLQSVTLYAGPKTPSTPATGCTADTDCSSGAVCSVAHTCLGATINTCKAATPQEATITCDTPQFSINTNHALISDNSILLTAMAVDIRGVVTQATVTVDIKPLTVVFTAPTISPGTTPPVANVGGTSPVGVSVTSAVPLASVVIVSETGAMVANWQSPATNTLTQPVDWAMVVGGGMHTLTATATDTFNDVGTATLNINVEAPSISFTAPMLTGGTTPPVAQVAGTSPVAVQVSSFLPLTSVAITYDGTNPLASWTTLPLTGPNFTMPIDWPVVMGLGPHVLTAVATDNSNETATATLNIVVQSISIVFTAPTGTGTPPTANVTAPSPVAVAVTSPLPIASVTITYPTGMTLASWTTPPAGMLAFSQNITWATTPGAGTFVLTATATDTSNDVATAQLTVVVTVPPTGCTSDAQCTNGERCCTTDGTCNMPVGTDDDCDCDHPCPTTQGCFPGICGATPQKCYNGCFPGSQSGAGTAPDACDPDPVTGQPYFCTPLPASQVTVANKGGSCVPGDNCDITTQNCPAMPLDRSQPPGPTNPDVAQDCLPVYPNVNGCFPAGTLALGAKNCTTNCGGGGADVTSNCATGLGCVQPVGSNGVPLGPATCEAQCDDPSFTRTTNPCPSNSKEICEGVYQPYGSSTMVDFTSGTCCVNSGKACTQATATQCCSGTCIAILNECE